MQKSDRNIVTRVLIVADATGYRVDMPNRLPARYVPAVDRVLADLEKTLGRGGNTCVNRYKDGVV